MRLDYQPTIFSRTCRLNDGTICNYDFCGDSVDCYSDSTTPLYYLGQGVILKINGINQDSDKQRHFWQKIETGTSYDQEEFKLY